MQRENEGLNSECDALTIKQLTRAKQKYKQSLLRGWLEQPSWAPKESRLLLVGLDPESDTTDRKSRRWLPSLSAEHFDVEDVPEEDEIQDRFRRVDGLRLTTGKPGDIIKKAFYAGIIIPWLHVAIHDEKCELPDDFREERKREERAEADKRASFDSRNAAMSALNAVKRAPAISAAQNTINGLDLKDYLKKNGKVNFAKVIEKIQDSHPELEKSDKTIRNWLKERKLIL
ncbi:hypothetical protein [Hoeflea ulvae]|uniref:RepB-like DNA primase domain-containing protein n=1 Tax=Hoeflea ulvae TaxID=2983764 RepID=A0ABT3YBW1_9HYPH|nr:hypothetical protein [Hoeflea ulvae]MCY0093255.1 hypothetical protein [Hoeflea ulvae]